MSQDNFTPPPLDDSVPSADGQPLGAGYRLFEVLGRGAMGEVRRGRTLSGDDVAVKLLRPELAGDPAMVARFLQERGILIGLAHPNIVRVLDLVAEGPTLAIVMDLIHGPDLRSELTRRGTFPPVEAAALTVGVLRGLGAVHATGVVHRDIKPENVLLAAQPDGSLIPRLSDFGVSKLVSGNVTSRRTSVIGTPDYMAPELIDDALPTVQSDLYSVGIMLYELVCGMPPFAGGSPLAILRKHVELTPGKPPGMPDQLWGLIGELLAKQPTARPASAGLVAASLEQLLPSLAHLPAAPPLTAPPAPDLEGATVLNTIPHTLRDEPTTRSRGGAGRIAAAALLVIALGAGGGALWWQSRSTSSAEPTATASSTPTTATPTDSATPTPTDSATPTPSSTDSPSASTAPSPTGSGNPTAILPVLTGRSLSEVVQTLNGLGTRYEVTEVLDAKAKDNIVVAQKPAPGQPAGDLVTVSVSRIPVVTYLADIGPVNGDVGSDTVSVNGVRYTHAISWYASCNNTQIVEYDLGKDFRRLQTTIGVTDDSDSSGAVATEIYLDDRRLAAKTTSLGKTATVSLDVTQGLRLRIQSRRTSCTDHGINVVFGDAQLLGLPSESGTPSPTP